MKKKNLYTAVCIFIACCCTAVAKDRTVNIKLDKTYAARSDAYQERYRPQFHFSPQTGWLNDPNGLVYYEGEYHLYYQAWPNDVQARGKIWSHAVSEDLIHWTQIDHALVNEGHRMIFSGSALVDHNNTAGLQKGKNKALIAIYTLTKPHVQCIAWSLDKGRTFTKYKEPVVGTLTEKNRDPKVFWYEPDKKWIMVLYLGERTKFVLLGSKDIKNWDKLSDLEIPDGHECPEMFEMHVDGNKKKQRWVVMDGQELYMVGQFDGEKFIPDTKTAFRSEWGHNGKAGQAWNDTPDGRIVFILWMKAKMGARVGGTVKEVYPGMGFSQQMSVPRELTLRTTSEGLRLYSWPVKEIERLRGKGETQSDTALKPGMNALSSVTGELFDIETEIEPGRARKIVLGIRGIPITWDAAARTLSCLGAKAEISPEYRKLKLRVLVDRTSMEIFAYDGRYVMSFCFTPEPGNKNLSLIAQDGEARIKSLKVWPLRSIWKR